MTKIYLIRHAEAEGNIYRRAHGHYNGLVTEKGHKQISLLKERFISEQIDEVYSSDLFRTLTTAMALSEPRNIKINAVEQLREVDMGEWEERPWGEIGYSDNEMNAFFNNDPAKWHVNGCEDYGHVGKRMLGYITEIAKKHDGECIAVFSHGFAIRTLLCLLKGIESHETNKMPYCDNTAVTLLKYENDDFTIEYAGDNSHLDKKHSTLEHQSWWRAEEIRKPENLRFLSLNDVAGESLVRIFKAKAGKRAQVNVQYAGFLSDEPVGIIGLDTLREENRKVGWISYIHVIPHRRGKTFGTQLLGQAVSDFRKLKRRKLHMELPSGSPGINFMLKCGFKVLLTTESNCLMEKEIINW